jgi:molybdopterin-guanine dinucleotide biosynthesis protein A
MTSHSERSSRRLSALLLCGGESKRFGGDKGLAMFRGRPLAERLLALLDEISDDVRISTNNADAYASLERPIVADTITGHGPLAGLQAGLHAARHELMAVVACDMPFASAALLRYMHRISAGYDVIAPLRPASHRAVALPPDGGSAQARLRYEPLHAIYSKRCLAPIERAIAEGDAKVVLLYGRVKVRAVPVAEWKPLVKAGTLTFANINTPDDLRRCEAKPEPRA